MPPKRNTQAESSATNTMNEGDSRFVKAMFDNMNSRPDIDWDKLGVDLGMTPKSAKERLRVLGRRYNWNTNATTAGGGGSPAKPKGTLAPKNTGKVAKTDAPKKKGTAQKKPKSKKQESDEDDDVSGKLESDSDGKTAAQDSSDSEE